MSINENLKEVEVISTGYYLPGNPIPFDKVGEALGEFTNIDESLKTRIKRYKGMMSKIIKACCYFAVDPQTKRPTENVTSLSVKAIKNALAKINMDPKDIELLVLGTPLPDYMTPPTTPYIQEELGIDHFTEMEIHSNCTAMTKAVEVAYNALKIGKYKNAVVVYTQSPSVFLNRDFYNQGKISIENLLLRWFLSDSSGALVLKAADKVNKGIKMTAVYNESIGNKLPPSMWLKFGAANFNLQEAFEKGEHHFAQDYQTVNKLGPIIQVKGLQNMLKQNSLRGKDIDHLLISIPSYKLEDTAKNKT